MALGDPLTKFGSGVGVGSTHQTVITTSIDIYANGEKIGFAQDINETSDRPTTRIRHLNAKDAGRVIEQAPGVEDISLTITGFAVYNKANSLIQQLAGRDNFGKAGGVIKCLNDQKIPFDIKKVTLHPSLGAEDKETVEKFGGCMITRYSRPIGLAGVTISDSVDINVSYKE